MPHLLRSEVAWSQIDGVEQQILDVGTTEIRYGTFSIYPGTVKYGTPGSGVLVVPLRFRKSPLDLHLLASI